MARFLIRLASAHVRNTRSRGADTIYASLQLLINGNPTPTVYWDGAGWNGSQLEDRGWNNGQHFFGTNVRSDVQIDTGNITAGDRIEVVFNVINKGHGGDPSDNDYKSASDAIARSICSSDGNNQGDSSGWACLAAIAGTYLVGWIFANCDGPIAADKVLFTGADLDRLVPNPPNLATQPEMARAYTWSRDYQGVDSPTGCGSNSNYRIDLALIRIP